MRLWHKKLIDILPRQQLTGQWRECCLIAKNLSNNGTPNHLLVNEILKYSLDHFFIYCALVYKEMKRRGFNVKAERLTRLTANQNLNDTFLKYIDFNAPTPEFLFCWWHNDRYLVQCYFNLQEKFDCGGIVPGRL